MIGELVGPLVGGGAALAEALGPRQPELLLLDAAGLAGQLLGALGQAHGHAEGLALELGAERPVAADYRVDRAGLLPAAVARVR